MNSVATKSAEATRTQHHIVTHRSLRALLQWAGEFAQEQSAAGRRVMWAHAHNIGGALSLQSTILNQAVQSIGTNADQDAPTLLSGACDTIIIADPVSADSASLAWLSDLLACAEAASEIAAVTPMPQLVVLTRTGVAGDAADSFLDRLRALGAKESRAAAKDSGPAPTDIRSLLEGVGARNKTLIGALALAPCPVEVEAFDGLAKRAGATVNAFKQLVGTELFVELDGVVVPTLTELRKQAREDLSDEVAAKAASALLPWLEQKFADLPEGRIEAMVLSGDEKKGLRLARRRFDEHYQATRPHEALKVLNLCRRLGLNLETGKDAAVVDEAKYAALNAENGNHETARAIVSDLSRRREKFRNATFVEWLALAARTLAIDVGYEPRNADSLMRRAIRMSSDNMDTNVRLTMLRVKLLRSRAFQLEERAAWLLSHINNVMLDQVSPGTLAIYLDETAGWMVEHAEYKAAFKRLKRLATVEVNPARLARTMLRMARCRAHFDDYESATRYASSALHYGMRAAKLGVVEDAVRFLRETERGKPTRLPRLTPSRATSARTRVPAAADIPTPQTPEAAKLFEVLESRFGVSWWVRRRGTVVQTFGSQPKTQPHSASIFLEQGIGVAEKQAGGKPDPNGAFALVLLRQDGDDMLVFTPEPDTEPREDGIVRMLQADRTTDESADDAPSRKAVVRDYLRRAVANQTKRGLHHTMEMLFNKDLLIYLEEQGLSKEEMAEKLGVSRATLYRMFARAGLN
jgi:hypothetical protein